MIGELQNQLKVAIKGKNKPLVTTLRNLIGKLKVEQINKGKKISKEETIKVLQKIAKQHRDSIKQYSTGGRDDLVRIEEFELSIVKNFLPKQISYLELEQKVIEVIKSINAKNIKDMGRIMNIIMKELSSTVDGHIVQKVIREKLNL